MTRQQILALRERISSISRDPHGPSLDRQEHVVTIRPPVSEDDYDRLADAREWCREHVDHDQGHRWSYRRVAEDDSVEVSFANDLEAVMFKMVFG